MLAPGIYRIKDTVPVFVVQGGYRHLVSDYERDIARHFGAGAIHYTQDLPLSRRAELESIPMRDVLMLTSGSLTNPHLERIAAENVRQSDPFYNGTLARQIEAAQQAQAGAAGNMLGTTAHPASAGVLAQLKALPWWAWAVVVAGLFFIFGEY